MYQWRPLLSRPRGAFGSGAAAVESAADSGFDRRAVVLVCWWVWMVVRFVCVIRVIRVPVCPCAPVCPVCVPAPLGVLVPVPVQTKTPGGAGTGIGTVRYTRTGYLSDHRELYSTYAHGGLESNDLRRRTGCHGRVSYRWLRSADRIRILRPRSALTRITRIRTRSPKQRSIFVPKTRPYLWVPLCALFLRRARYRRTSV